MGMARRLNPKHDAHTREKIQTSQLVNRLNSFVLSGVDPKTKKPIEMSREQITVALGLLKKTLPDLSSVELNVLFMYSFQKKRNLNLTLRIESVFYF